jgi:hypothetical protein
MPASAKPMSMPWTGFSSLATGRGELTAMVFSSLKGKIVESVIVPPAAVGQRRGTLLMTF